MTGDVHLQRERAKRYVYFWVDGIHVYARPTVERRREASASEWMS